MKKISMVLAGWLLAIGLAFAQVNINTANKNELDGLKGIGPVKAQAILDYRHKNGPFKSADELLNVPGIGPEILKDMRSGITISGVSHPVAPAAPAKPVKPATPSLSKPVASAPPAPATPLTPLAAPAKPAIPALAAPAKPASPAAPALPGKEVAETKAPAPAAPARPAHPPAH